MNKSEDEVRTLLVTAAISGFSCAQRVAKAVTKTGKYTLHTI